jgi:Ca2+-binding EF-hand superfamily protein
MRNAFKHFNKDKNHFISFENFARTLREFELKLLPADVQALFSRYDRCVPLLPCFV